MPELPEVELVRRRLRRVMEGARLERVLTYRRDLRFPLAADFVSRLEGQTVRAIRRRAKYLVAELSSGEILLMHLGMSGSFRVLSNHRADRSSVGQDVTRIIGHDHVVFQMSSGALVVFNDPRRFGFMRIIGAGSAATDTTLGSLGPEPLDRAFTAAALAKALKGKKTSLKAALSDQRIVAGLGNIYVCEALHLARLSPKRRAATIASRSGDPTGRTRLLADAIRTVLRAAIASGLRRQYREHRFRVYDRAGQRCLRRRCSGVIRRIVQVGRATFYCPVCQR
ncbi:MAG: bifunctional DNA-formamidopyrimidine glycosylase/DNA-(apurinic or apyrimidinic site) lyase [Blastocatellia bacterium]|nr:MAG: bifunctional DNA-formamidopyrimidine glycosylase/DNA-(apurinic or apyrimidinic site) lyase [Blastocatellia bacterium]